MPAAPYLVPADVRAMYPVFAGDDALVKYPDAAMVRKIARFESMAERARGTAYRRREATERITIDDCDAILLAHVNVAEITAISFSSGDAPDVADVEIDDDGISLLLPSGRWPGGRRATITYLHGHEAPPQCILDGAALFVRCELAANASAAPENVIAWTDQATGYSFREGTADWGAGRYCKWIGVNDAINEAPDEREPGFA